MLFGRYRGRFAMNRSKRIVERWIDAWRGAQRRLRDAREPPAWFHNTVCESCNGCNGAGTASDVLT
jgi:hypothetical protein